MKKMKKIITRIIALALVAVFFAAPSSALAASTSVPVLLHDIDGFKSYQYQPGPLELYKTSTNLPDITGGHPNGFWSVPAGNTFLFSIDALGTYEIFVVREGSAQVIYNKITSGGDFFIFPESTSDAKYGVWIRAVDNLEVSYYHATVY